MEGNGGSLSQRGNGNHLSVGVSRGELPHDPETPRYWSPVVVCGVAVLSGFLLLGIPETAQAGMSCVTYMKTAYVNVHDPVTNTVIRSPSYYPEMRCEHTYEGRGRNGDRDRAGRGRENQGGRGVDKPNETAKEQRTDEKTKCGDTAGNPVVLSTGNKLEREFDFSSSGEMGLFLRRTYNHYWSATGLFGSHWLSNFDYSIAPSTDRSWLWLQRPDGRRIKFIRNATGDRWNEEKPEAVAYIVPSGDGGYILHGEDNGVERYNAEGYVLEVRNEHGIAWAFRYDGKYLQDVTHSSGRTVRFTWSNGQLVRVTDPAGGFYDFTYTANALGTGRHRLASATLPGAPATTVAYHYEDSRFPGALTGKSFNDVRYSTFAYDAEGRAIRTEHAGGVERYEFSYAVESTEQVTPPPAPPPPGGYEQSGEPTQGWCEYQSGSGRICYQPRSMPVGGVTLMSGGMVAASTSPSKTIPVRLRVTETNPLGKKTVHHYEDDRKTQVEGLASPSCPTASKFVTYDANGYEDVVTDFNGRSSNYDYDAKGYLTQLVEGVGTAAQRTTNYAWDVARNRPTAVTVVGDRETIFAYETDGRIKSITTRNLNGGGVVGQVRTTNFQYTRHANGMLATQVEDGGLSGDTVTTTYSSVGDVLSVRDGAGHVTTYSNHNGLGQPRTVTGPNGDVTEYVYDERGRLTEERAIVAGQAQVARYAYNGAGDLVSAISPDNRQRNFVYDAAKRLTEEYEREPSGSYARRTIALNAMSLPLQIEVKRTTYPYNTRIVGNIDGVEGSDVAGFVLRGWACSSGQNASVSVHMYAGGAAGSGTYAGAFNANLASEPGVSAACSAQGSAYRFSIPLTSAIRDVHGGKAAYVHGISPTGTGNLLLTGSGAYNIPRLLPNVAPTGLAAPTSSISGSWSVTWNSAARATRYRLEESANGGAWTTIHDAAETTRQFSGKGAGAYSYRVAACNEVGCGPVSNIVTVTRIVAPSGAPSPGGPPVNDTSAYTIGLSSVAGATYYVIDESTNGTNWGQIHNGAAVSVYLSGRNTTIDHLYRARACNEAGCGPTSGTITVQRAIYGAQFIGKADFGLTVPGAYHTVSVQMRNTGNTTWSDGSGYRLGSQNPGDNQTWGLSRVGVSGSVPPGGVATFSFTVRAPGATGLYNFQWRMVRDDYAWFGDSTPNNVIEVATAQIYSDPGACALYIGQSVCNVVVYWQASRSDAQLWVSNLDGSGWQLFSPQRSGAQNAPWIPLSGKRFHVVAAGVVLGAIDISAYQLNEFPPDPDPPGGCVPSPPLYTCDPV